jgi:hypothetical protein
MGCTRGLNLAVVSRIFRWFDCAAPSSGFGDASSQLLVLQQLDASHVRQFSDRAWLEC